MTQFYSRQEAIALSRSTSNRLSYLDRAELVTPLKSGSGKKPVCLYTKPQIEQIRLIDEASHHLNHETIRAGIARGCLAELTAAIEGILSASSPSQRQP
jgi:hypothetical protein